MSKILVCLDTSRSPTFVTGGGQFFGQTYTRNGKTLLTKGWAMKIAHEGRRETFPLDTPNKAAAAARARDIYLSLAGAGWEVTLARYKRAKALTREGETSGPHTVGQFLDEVFRTASNQQTVESYAKKFRQIVAEIFDLLEGKEKHDSWRGGTEKWLTKVHAVKLEEVTPARVEEWKRSFLAKAGSDPMALRRTRISANSMLRQARSLFSPKRLRHFEPRQSEPTRKAIGGKSGERGAKDRNRDWFRWTSSVVPMLKWFFDVISFRLSNTDLIIGGVNFFDDRAYLPPTIRRLVRPASCRALEQSRDKGSPALPGSLVRSRTAKAGNRQTLRTPTFSLSWFRKSTVSAAASAPEPVITITRSASAGP